MTAPAAKLVTWKGGIGVMSSGRGFGGGTSRGAAEVVEVRRAMMGRRAWLSIVSACSVVSCLFLVCCRCSSRPELHKATKDRSTSSFEELELEKHATGYQGRSIICSTKEIKSN